MPDPVWSGSIRAAGVGRRNPGVGDTEIFQVGGAFGYTGPSIEPGVGFAATEVPLVIETGSRVSDEVAALRREIRELREALANRPRLMQIATLDSEGLRLRLPVPIEVERAGENAYAARTIDFDFYATGDEEDEAIANLRATIVEEFEYLTDNEARLGPHPASQLRRLRELVERRA